MKLEDLVTGIAKLTTLGVYQNKEASRKMRELAATYKAIAQLCEETAAQMDAASEGLPK